MVAGHLREQNGYFQMILSWKGADGKRKSKSISTGLAVKGNKKRAEAMLLKTRKEFNPENLLENADMPFHVFLNKWLKENAFSFSPSTYAEYAYDVRSQIEPFFEKHPIGLLKMSGRDLEAFYRYERQEHEASSQELLQYHEIIVAAFQYAVELTWLKENPVAHINPCADEAPILFTDFILEWLEMMKSSVELTTYSSYANSIKGSIVPYFKDKMLTLQDLEKHPKHIQDYYQFELGKGLTANTVIHRHANIRKCLQYAFQIGLIKSNPADRVERPRKDKYLATIYNQQELEILFKTVKGDPIELGVILAAFYGLRRSEVVGLKWDAIDFEKKTHEQCARQMGISRTTVTEMYETARFKIADCLVNGKQLRITGGNYRLCDGSARPCCGRDCRKAGIAPDSQADYAKGASHMKIAVTYENGNVFQHFGHTEQFKIYDISNNEIAGTQIVSAAGSGHGALAGFLAELRVDTLICGGIGAGAQNALTQAGIRFYGGFQAMQMKR